MVTEGARDFPADVWGLVYEAAGQYERTSLRQVCKSARDGVDRKREHLTIWGHIWGHRDPSRRSMLGLMRRLPRLRTIQLRFSNKNGCLRAMQAVRDLADLRGMDLRMEGTVLDSTSTELPAPRLRGRRFEKAVQEAQGFEDASAFMTLKPRSQASNHRS